MEDYKEIKIRKLAVSTKHQRYLLSNNGKYYDVLYGFRLTPI